MSRTEAQRQLGETVGAFAARSAGTLRVTIESPLGYDPEVWAGITAMGLPGIAVDEQYGGGGGEPADLAVALEELGRWLTPSPLFAGAALAIPLLQHSGDEAAMQRWLPGIAAGELHATAARPENCSLRLSADGRLSGTVTRLVGGVGAGLILVSVRRGGAAELFGVEVADGGASIEQSDGPLDPTRRLATAHFEDVAAVPITADPEAQARALDTARLLLAAEQVGGAQRCLDMALEHATGRRQFGRPIGSFQAIKHLCADMYSDIACARALVHDALRSNEHLAVSAASVVASEGFVRAAERTMQIHGGISYTWEHACHLYLRRARASERLLGTVRDSYNDIALSLPL